MSVVTYHTTNARFLVWVNGDRVTLSLTPGDSLSHSHFARTDEGFESGTVTWSLDDGVVTLDSWSESRDCDGAHRSSTTLECHVTELQSHEYDGALLPKWAEVGSSQRDYSAEQAGY